MSWLLNHDKQFEFSYPKLQTHETSRVVGIRTDLSVDFNESLHDDLGNLVVVQGILETIAEENNHWKRFPQLVGTSAGSWSKNTTQFVQHP